MVKLRKGARTYGPSSTIGLMRFFDSDSKAPKVSPQFLFGFIGAVVLVVLVLKTLIFSGV